MRALPMKATTSSTRTVRLMTELECPGCGDLATFSEDGQFGNLTCDSCGYMPRASVREEIRSELNEA